MNLRRVGINDCFYLALSLLIIRFTLTSYREYMEFPIFAIAIPLLLFKIIRTKYTAKEIVKIVLVVLVLGTAAIVSKKMLPMWSGIVLIASKNIDLRKMFKYCLYTELLMLVAIIIVPLVTGEEIYVLIYRAGVQREVKRYQFGIGHPNGFQFLALQIFLSYVGMSKQLLKYKEIFFFIILNTFFVILSNSRTSYMVFWLAVILIELLNTNLGKKLSYYLSFSPFVCAVFCLVSTELIGRGNKFVEKLDLLFEHRILFAHQYIEKYPFNLFGHYIYELTLEGEAENYHALDCGYINLLLNNGLILFVLFIALYTTVLKYLYKQCKYNLFILGVVYSVYFIMEGALLGFYKNLFIIIFGTVLFKQRIKETDTIMGERHFNDLCSDHRRLRKSVL